MTLVVVLSSADADYVIGDILLSVDKQDAGATSPYPTKPSFPVHSDVAITELIQKIVVIGSGVLLGFAGFLSDARSLIDFLDFDFEANKTTQSARDSFRIFFESNPDKYQTLQAVLLTEDASGRYMLQKNCITVSTRNFDQVVVLGSGADEFIRYVDRIDVPTGSWGQHTPSDADKIAFVLDYITSTLKYQKQTGFGLSRAWGGGFEIALKKNGKYPEKIDNIFFHSYTYHVDAESIIQFVGDGSRTFQFYDGAVFRILTQPYRQIALAYDVPPPLNRPTNPPKRYFSDRRANLVFISYSDAKSGRSFFELLYDEKGSEHFSVKYAGGTSYIIDVKISYLRERVARYLQNRHSDPVSTT